ncbi:MAG: zinc ribbon domain-containing protein [Planctomycetaceae bacterium]|nr:zinc ribbon domain-containing protein [Planctomycetaceae bacterium]
MFCPTCGNNLPANAAFCSQCGNTTSSTQSPPHPQTSP